MTSEQEVRVRLPCGLWAEGQRWPGARLRELRGSDELFLAEQADQRSPASTANALLSRCLQRLGPHEPVPPEAVGKLAVGDRDALLLHLRRTIAGDRVDSTVTCPEEGCGVQMDLTLEVDDLLQPGYDDGEPEQTLSVEADGATYEVRCRRPKVADIQAAARASRDAVEASAEVLGRCVVSAEGPDGAPGDPAKWPPELVAAVSEGLSELDPQAELNLHTTCPECDSSFTCLFDPASYVVNEIGRGEGILREVHHLALYYSWGEAEILAMPRRRRRRYLDVLDRALDREGAR